MTLNQPRPLPCLALLCALAGCEATTAAGPTNPARPASKPVASESVNGRLVRIGEQ